MGIGALPLTGLSVGWLSMPLLLGVRFSLRPFFRESQGVLRGDLPEGEGCSQDQEDAQSTAGADLLGGDWIFMEIPISISSVSGGRFTRMSFRMGTQYGGRVVWSTGSPCEAGTPGWWWYSGLKVYVNGGCCWVGLLSNSM